MYFLHLKIGHHSLLFERWLQHLFPCETPAEFCGLKNFTWPSTAWGWVIMTKFSFWGELSLDIWTCYWGVSTCVTDNCYKSSLLFTCVSKLNACHTNSTTQQIHFLMEVTLWLHAELSHFVGMKYKAAAYFVVSNPYRCQILSLSWGSCWYDLLYC